MLDAQVIPATYCSQNEPADTDTPASIFLPTEKQLSPKLAPAEALALAPGQDRHLSASTLASTWAISWSVTSPYSNILAAIRNCVPVAPMIMPITYPMLSLSPISVVLIE